MNSDTPRSLLLQESYLLASSFILRNPLRPPAMPHTMRRCAQTVIGRGCAPFAARVKVINPGVVL